MAKCECCGQKLHVIFIERHHPDRVVTMFPKGHQKYPEGKMVTYREEIEEGRMYMRRDIVLINGDGKQWAVYPTWNGVPEGDGWDLLSQEEKQRAVDLNAEILRVAEEYPKWGDVYLGRPLARKR